MFTTTVTTLREAVRRRTKAALEALADRGISEADVHSVFASRFRDRAAADAAWLRLKRLENPAAGELALYAAALQVNTTWLLTGDVRFINVGLMSGTCLCWLLPEAQHCVRFDCTDPIPARDYNPGCLVHGRALEETRRWREELLEVSHGQQLAAGVRV